MERSEVAGVRGEEAETSYIQRLRKARGSRVALTRMVMEIKTHHATLSQAIREGAKLRPQIGGTMHAPAGSCAIGAASEALFEGNRFVPGYHEVAEVFPYIEHVSIKCPAESECTDEIGTKPLGSIVVHLNDHHRWTREAIADWLETEEEKLGFVLLSEEAVKPQVALDRDVTEAEVSALVPLNTL